MKLYKLPDHLKPKGKATLEMHLEVDHGLEPVEINEDDLDINNAIWKAINPYKLYEYIGDERTEYMVSRITENIENLFK